MGELTTHIAYIVKEARARHARVVEVTKEAEREWCDTIVRMGIPAKRFNKECTPSYRNNEGRMTDADIRRGFYGGGSVGFTKVLEEWRSAGGLLGLALHF